jgi:hypothetical protein
MWEYLYRFTFQFWYQFSSYGNEWNLTNKRNLIASPILEEPSFLFYFEGTYKRCENQSTGRVYLQDTSKGMALIKMCSPTHIRSTKSFQFCSLRLLSALTSDLSLDCLQSNKVKFFNFCYCTENILLTKLWIAHTYNSERVSWYLSTKLHVVTPQKTIILAILSLLFLLLLDNTNSASVFASWHCCFCSLH